MKSYLFLLMWNLGIILTLESCHQSKEPPTVQTPQTEETAQAVNRFSQNPSDAEKTRTDAAFIRLDLQISELQNRTNQSTGVTRTENQARLDDLKARRDQLVHEYDQAKFDQLQLDTQNLLARLRESTQQAVQNAASSAEATGDQLLHPTADDPAPNHNVPPPSSSTNNP